MSNRAGWLLLVVVFLLVNLNIFLFTFHDSFLSASELFTTIDGRGFDEKHQTNPKVCIVVRTFSGHSDGSLLRFLNRTLQRFRNPNWEAIVVDLDLAKPWPRNSSLESIVASVGDPRIRLASKMAPRYTQSLAFGHLDKAIEECSLDSEWLLSTNADNDFHPEALSVADPQYDLVGFDFFSRYWLWLIAHMNGGRNVEFNCSTEWVVNNAAVIHTQFRVHHVDLASVLFSLTRWRHENRSYMGFQEIDPEDSARDGKIFPSLLEAGWRGKVLDKVMLSHGPNSWECMRNHPFVTKGLLMHWEWCSRMDNPELVEEVKSLVPVMIKTYDEDWNEKTMPCYDTMGWRSWTNPNRMTGLLGALTQKRLFGRNSTEL